jgi:hypothetical protein
VGGHNGPHHYKGALDGSYWAFGRFRYFS